MATGSAEDLVVRVASAQIAALAPPTPEPFLSPATSPGGLVTDLLEGGTPTLVVAEPGGGKTTLLRNVVMRQQEQALRLGGKRGALFVSARDLAGQSDWPALLRAHIASTLCVKVTESVLRQAIGEGILGLTVDGLDELSAHDQRQLVDQIAVAIDAGDLSALLISSRPIGLPTTLLRRTRVVELPRLDQTAALAFLDQALPGQQHRFMELYELSGGNPGLLSMLAQVTARRGMAPARRVDIYRDAIEGQLNVLAERLVPLGEMGPTTRSILAAHGDLALTMLREDAHEFAEGRVAEIFARHLLASQVDALLELEGARTDMLLRSTGPDSVSFSHRSFAEFLAASVVHDDPEQLRELAELPAATNALGLALGLSSDPAVGLIALADQPGLNVLERLGPLLAELPSGAIERARRTLSERLAGVLPGGGGPPEEPAAQPPTSDGSPDLLERWLALEASQAKGYERGRELELFMVDFFGRFFNVVKHDYRTETGQIDLLLENRQMDPFWNGYDSDMYVECKNTRAETEVGAVNSFAGKLSEGPTTVAFFVSQAGFTDQGWNRLRKAAYDRDQTTIVPIVGQDIRRTLEDGEEPERFFKYAIRDTRHGLIF